MDFKKMKVQDLRDELAKKGMDTSGLKNALIMRLEAISAATDTVTEAAAANEATVSPISAGIEDNIATGTVSTDPLADAVPPEAAPVSANIEDAATTVENGADAAVPTEISEAEKKAKRAERFGIEPVSAEDDKKKKRAEKFGIVSEVLKKAARADRFGISKDETAKTTKETRTQALADRGGPDGKKASSNVVNEEELEKRKRRAEKFGLPIKPNDELEERKKQRAERFSIATA